MRETLSIAYTQTSDPELQGFHRQSIGHLDAMSCVTTFIRKVPSGKKLEGLEREGAIKTAALAVS
jgi:hypothetical protein